MKRPFVKVDLWLKNRFEAGFIDSLKARLTVEFPDLNSWLTVQPF